ncbi:carbohydrate ABC transporter permease [Mesorhizobium marinum]|uniref:carbohydrate ABC transporter permease n=1 Tax=Mesorhizobium marinum TaxID=3228790 RepID=UPI003465F5B2
MSAGPAMRRSASARTLHMVALTGLAIVVAFPVYWMIVLAMTPLGFSRQITSILPSDLTFDNFASLVVERPMLRWLWNSTLVAALSSGISMLIGLSCGYALSRLRFRGSYVVLVLVLASQMVPSTSILVPLYTLFMDLGLLNTIHGVVIGHISLVLPLAIWMSKGFFDSLPEELEGAARLDGCSRLGALWFVAIPLVSPGLVAIFVYGFVTSWNDFLFPRHFVQSENLWTAAAGLTSFRGEYFTLFEPQMAASLVFAFPVVVLFFVLQRRMVSGSLTGGVK